MLEKMSLTPITAVPLKLKEESIPGYYLIEQKIMVAGKYHSSKLSRLAKETLDKNGDVFVTFISPVDFRITRKYFNFVKEINDIPVLSND